MTMERCFKMFQKPVIRSRSATAAGKERINKTDRPSDHLTDPQTLAAVNCCPLAAHAPASPQQPPSSEEFDRHGESVSVLVMGGRPTTTTTTTTFIRNHFRLLLHQFITGGGGGGGDGGEDLNAGHEDDKKGSSSSSSKRIPTWLP